MDGHSRPTLAGAPTTTSDLRRESRQPTPEQIEGVKAIVKERGYELLI